jgi:RNA polymerase sigma-70 factor (ECF subfamily)
LALRVDDVDLIRDRALVERFQEGDHGAFETLYVRYFARLTRFCQKRVGDAHEAEEIAQEAFTRALRALPTFEGERRFYPWMTVIAGRLCVDAHRRRGRTETREALDLGVIEGGQEKVVDDVDVAILSEALGRIAPRHREVLDLREQQDWSYQRIADHYGVTMGTVEALLFRARRALRREFMAVIGGERNWAAIPAFGAVLRRIASFKARVDAWAAALSPVAGTAMTVAVAVATVTAAVGAVTIGGTRSPAPVSVSASLASAPADPPAAISMGPAVEASPRGPAVAAPTQAPPGRVLVPADPGGVVVPAPASPVEVHDGRGGQERSDRQPIARSLETVGYFGADPVTATRDSAIALETYAVQTHGSSK